MSAPSNQPESSIAGVKISVCWHKGYGDIKSAKDDADVVVLGTITSIKGVQNEREHDGHLGFVSTDFVFTTEHIVLDAGHLLTDSTIIIHQTGGIVNDLLYKVKDDPLFQVNERAVLFLYFYKLGYAYVCGGPTGRFIVQDGLVQPRDLQWGMRSMRSLAIPVADFITQIQNA